MAALPVFRSLERGRAISGAAHAFRELCRQGKHTSPTSGCVPGAVQANLVVLPKEHAHDFTQFCLRNPQSCPLLDVSAPGCPLALRSTRPPHGNVATDVPRYRVWRHGKVHPDEDGITDVSHFWGGQHERMQLVSFLLGCSFSWEHLLAGMGPSLAPRHISLGQNVPMYRTKTPNARYGPFGGHLVVSMRPYARRDVATVQALTARFPAAHGAPVQVGEPAALGILDLARPDFGDPPDLSGASLPGELEEVPVFHCCGVTPQAALEEAALPFAITHAPGHMMILDCVSSDLDLGPTPEPS